MKIEIYRDSEGDYRWRAKAKNGKTVAGPQEGYSSKDKCRKGFLAARAVFVALNWCDAVEDRSRRG